MLDLLLTSSRHPTATWTNSDSRNAFEKWICWSRSSRWLYLKPKRKFPIPYSEYCISLEARKLLTAQPLVRTTSRTRLTPSPASLTLIRAILSPTQTSRARLSLSLRKRLSLHPLSRYSSAAHAAGLHQLPQVSSSRRYGEFLSQSTILDASLILSLAARSPYRWTSF